MAASTPPHTRHDRTGQPPEQGHTATTNSSNNYNLKKSKLFSPPALLLREHCMWVL